MLKTDRSIANEVNLVCRCRNAVVVTGWELIDGPARPDLAKLVASGELFVNSCPDCGHGLPRRWPLGILRPTVEGDLLLVFTRDGVPGDPESSPLRHLRGAGDLPTVLHLPYEAAPIVLERDLDSDLTDQPRALAEVSRSKRSADAQEKDGHRRRGRPEEVRDRVRALFDAAKEKNEFEFASTLMRVRGMEDIGWDPFEETHRPVGDLMTLLGAPLVGHTKARLGSHLTEVWTIYAMLANLTRVASGERYVIDPFLDAAPRNRRGEPQFLSTPGTVRALSEMLEEARHSPVRKHLTGTSYRPSETRSRTPTTHSTPMSSAAAPSSLKSVAFALPI